MAERSGGDNALIEEIDAVRRVLVDLDLGVLTEAWRRLALIDAPPEYRAQVAEACLASADRLTQLARHLVQDTERSGT
jgi:hypothetical protein